MVIDAQQRVIASDRNGALADYVDFKILEKNEKPKSGIVPYVKFGAYNTELLSGAFAALRVATAKKMLI